MPCLVLLLLAAEPQFIGGVEPKALTVTPMVVDEAPVGSACSTETLRRSKPCHFDARPLVAAQNDRDRQAKDNVALAERIGRGLCLQRNANRASELTARVTACVTRVRAAARDCELEGLEALIDTEGRFSTLAPGCYRSLAEALQLGDVPAQPAEASHPVQKTATPSTEL